MKIFKSLAILLVFVFTFGVFTNSAKAENEIIADCAEYYNSQSVKLDLKTDKLEYAPGETVNFTGSIINTNNYVIADGYLYVRIAKKNTNYVAEGHNIIDEFFGIEKISINALKDKNISFDWRVPSTLAGGNFTASFFFSIGKKFDLAGFPYTNEVIGGFTDFIVKTTNYQEILLDKSKTSINGQPYAHIGQQPIFAVSSSTVTITQPVKNTYKEAKVVKVKCELFFWDSVDSEQDKISSKTEEFVILKNSTKDLVYKLDKIDQTNYYLKITATSGGDKSIVNVRFGSNLERPRLKFLTLTNFPLKKGETNSLFTCFNNTSTLNTTGKVIVTLLDKNDLEIARLDYSGEIYSTIMARKKEFLSGNDYTYFRLKAEVYDSKDALVDKYEGVYDCKDIISGKCAEIEALVPSSPISKPDGSRNIPIIVSGVALLIIVVLIIVLTKRRKAADEY